MPAQANQNIILLDVILFIVCLLVVVRVLPYGIAFAIVLICTLCADRTTLRDVDYSLLLTFVAFFVKGVCGFANTLVFTSILSYGTANANNLFSRDGKL